MDPRNACEGEACQNSSFYFNGALNLEDEADETNFGSFGRISELCGLTIEDRQSLLIKLPQWPARQDLLRKLLNASKISENVLFCFDDYLILLYRDLLKVTCNPLNSDSTGKRIAFKNEIVDPSASLRCEVLRAICVSVELLEFKCVHIVLENSDPSYGSRKQKAETRLKRLKEHSLISEAEYETARELYLTRCGFAHSIVDVSEITFRSNKLKTSWSSSSNPNGSNMRYFLKDAFTHTQKLLDLFKPVQSQQIDLQKFVSCLRSELQ